MTEFILVHIFHHSEKLIFDEVIKAFPQLRIDSLPDFYKNFSDMIGVFSDKSMVAEDMRTFYLLAKEIHHHKRKKLLDFAAQYPPEVVDIGENTIYVNHVKAYNEMKAFVNSNKLNFTVFLGKLWERNPFEIEEKPKKKNEKI